jgi:alkanesulfonate monooxygenase SsuD/methylene tetrahydromethanopterin reductase-like flavin-dependent oxidoreductase (luciferase family)
MMLRTIHRGDDGRPVDLGLFYEIPVPKPWDARSEQRAYRETIEQAVLGDQLGFHSFWTVEHHFLEEFSHCSNPEVLYGAIAALTTNIRIGYGVRLLPKPYNHPVRTAESVAVLDLVSNGRVEFGTGRSSTRMEIEGFGINPHDTRDMWSEALDCIVGAWTEDEFTFDGKYWKVPAPRRVVPRVLQDPHPPIWAATSSLDGHKLIGEKGIGLLSFTLGVPPSELASRIALYREGVAACRAPVGKTVNDRTATFAMVHCAPTRHEAYEVARSSMEWYPARSVELFGALATWMAGEDLGTYAYLGATATKDVKGMFNFDRMVDEGWIIVGDPDDCIEAAGRYRDAGVDLMLCDVNPYAIPHDKVVQSIRLLGEQVIPAVQ